ncbi:C40 family peptidase [Streptomyces sp. TRM66268-LWL]|uniref:C40 family peptidase n=1 Tax=Streptomyces polyasparticus TaxID=2767826 RepID=A0ABR7SVZ0_9ACTN|nr:C40 family peptidase [Streptomyces polyasparticus]MBC9719677.1 C40 family peptidase [Streptomyces polyasparticus]
MRLWRRTTNARLNAHQALQQLRPRVADSLGETEHASAQARQHIILRDLSRDRAGALARWQYRTGPTEKFSLYVFASDFDDLYTNWMTRRMVERAASAIHVRARTESEIRSAAARVAKSRLRGLQSQLRSLERTLESASLRHAQQLAAMARGFGDGYWQPGHRVPGRPQDLLPDDAAADATYFALRQLGKAYVWGATSPETYDCSGLTSRAWSSAGVLIPRTSQIQHAGLPAVSRYAPLRPGDLVIYFADATHVGLYVGEGLVVHAPRPGQVVGLTSLNRMPIKRIVRPDTAARPLRYLGASRPIERGGPDTARKRGDSAAVIR